MKTILYISSSLHGEEGQSSQLARQFLSTKQEVEAGLRIIERNVGLEPIPHLNAETFQGFQLEPSQRNATQTAAANLSDQLINELRSADEILIGMPLYNLGVPSTFKAWIDYIARAGQTFKYTENGPQGLLEDKKITIIAARGGSYQGTALDTQSDYLRHIFGLIGLTQLEFIYAENLALGGDIAEKSRQNALDTIRQHAA
ncbi:NAD(P)H-dependent oxidoreductase [Spongiibacter sp. KMU-158]|uniref:FMN dependent NADH:quinone oxidoreductase n=1 Tax=Spongiibacter pelagi TaxID=2760804 RepID=A0A927GV68_9GAMM|nr:NAD(P)H-dependent oxidoreductase [Spongiibacter pelagi]MBD2857567.1 NAD(P)H-dependent oxidoreductase [Spongiibacter pelagi]